MVIETWPRAPSIKWNSVGTEQNVLKWLINFDYYIFDYINYNCNYIPASCLWRQCVFSLWAVQVLIRSHQGQAPSLTFLPLHCRYAGHLTIKMFYKYLLSDTHPPLLNCRPVGQMSIWHVLCFTVLILSRELRPAYWSNSLPSEQQTLLHWPHTMPSQHLNINASIPGH